MGTWLCPSFTSCPQLTGFESEMSYPHTHTHTLSPTQKVRCLIQRCVAATMKTVKPFKSIKSMHSVCVNVYVCRAILKAPSYSVYCVQQPYAAVITALSLLYKHTLSMCTRWASLMVKTHAGSKVCVTESERDERIVNMFFLFVLSLPLWEPTECVCFIFCF